MKDLDKESRENLIEVIHISGLILLTGSLFFFIFYFIYDLVPYWILGIVGTLCGFIVKKVEKVFSLKQLYSISLLLIVINVLIY